MKILIKNCNSVDEAEINIEPNKLNIKYGMNGTGKSTIAKAIELSVDEKKDLSALKPFKYRGKEEKPEFCPSIVGVDALKTIMVFNEEYIDQFLFQPNEVLKNSFEIFIKNKDYEKRMAEIEKLVIEIKDTYKNNAHLDQVIKDLGELSDSFGKSTTGFTKVSRIGRGISKGNPVKNIPAGLEDYSDFIKSTTNVNWIEWQIEGNKFLELSTKCPYCTTPTESNKEKILSVSTQYNSNAIKHLNALQEILDRLGNYFTEAAKLNLQTIIRNKGEITAEQTLFLNSLKTESDTLKGRLTELKYISFYSLKDVEKVTQEIERLKIDLKMFSSLKSENTIVIVNELNGCLDKVVVKANVLQGEITQQKLSIESTINKYKTEINEFLKYAGYKYSVDILEDSDSYKMILRHEDFAEAIENAGKCLSYGESNAFSLVLFMYECLSFNPDLIILDDPISSFDRNKKFAIIEMLFRKKGNFQKRTVLMLTHDIEPIIDIVRNFSSKFAEFSTACFLRSTGNKVQEIAINRSDIITFTQVCKENITTHAEDIIKLIYLRRYQEILDNKSIEYQILSSLFHKKADPNIQDEDRLMTTQEISDATTAIRKFVPAFEYFDLLARINDVANMNSIYNLVDNNYEKLQLFRIIHNDNHDNDVLKKFVNETYHIENEYVMQLNPHKYDFVPDYIIAECDNVIKTLQPTTSA